MKGYIVNSRRFQYSPSIFIDKMKNFFGLCLYILLSLGIAQAQRISVYPLSGGAGNLFATNSPVNGYYLTTDGTNYYWASIASATGAVSVANLNAASNFLWTTMFTAAWLSNSDTRAITITNGLLLTKLTADRILGLNSAGAVTNGNSTLANVDNFFRMGITNIVSGNGTIVITTNTGVLTLTSSGGAGGGPFNVNQFATTGGTTNIKAGAYVTNILHWGDYYVDGRSYLTNGFSIPYGTGFNSTNGGELEQIGNIYFGNIAGGNSIFVQSNNAIIVRDGGSIVLGEVLGTHADTSLRISTNAYISEYTDNAESNRYRFNSASSSAVLQSNNVMRLWEVRTNINWTNVIYFNVNDGKNYKAVIEAAPPGTLIKWGPGTFLLPPSGNSQIMVPQGVSFDGAGITLTTLKLANYPATAVDSAFIVQSNHYFSNFRCDLTNRTTLNAYNSAFGAVSNSTALSSNIFFENIRIDGASDTVFYSQDIPAYWNWKGCIFNSGFDVITMQQSSMTNVYFDFADCRFELTGDTAMHWVNANASGASIDRGHVRYYNCVFHGRGIVNLYGIGMINPAGSDTTIAAAEVYACKFDLQPLGGIVKHAVQVRGKLIFSDGNSIDLTKTDGNIQNVQPTTHAASLYLSHSNFYFGPYSNTVVGSNITWGVRPGSPEGIDTAAPGSVRVNTDIAASTNAPIYIKANGIGNTGWQPVLGSNAVRNLILANPGSSVTIQSNGTQVAAQTTVNFIEGTNVIIRATNNSGASKIDVQINAVAGTGTGSTNNIVTGQNYSIISNNVYYAWTNAGSGTSLNVDWKGPSVWSGQSSGNLTIGSVNTPVAGDKAQSILVEVFLGGAHTVAFPSGFDTRGASNILVQSITNKFLFSFDGTNLFLDAFQEGTTGSGLTVLTKGSSISNAIVYDATATGIAYLTSTNPALANATPTNHIINVDDGVVYMNGATNINLFISTNAVSGWSNTKQYFPTLIITNKSASSTLFSFSPVTNQWRSLQQFEGVTSGGDITVTNGQALYIGFSVINSNVWYSYKQCSTNTF